VIQRFKGLKQVVNSLFRAIPGVINVSQVCLLCMLVYALFGMQFLSGRMRACNDPAIGSAESCVGTFVTEDGVTLPRAWVNDDIGNFDNFLYAMLTLFEMSTLEMWPDVMFRAMDADCPGCPLRQDANRWMSLFMISWVVLSAFFLFNLFVGVVLENFYAIRKQEDGSGLMSDEQKEWTRTITSILTVKAEKALRAPGGKSAWAKFRRRVFMLVQGDSSNKEDPKRLVPIAFEKFIITLVLLNVGSMTLSWYGQPEYMYDFADVMDVFFTAAFFFEMVLKITGLGLRQYLLSPWNIFDAVLVIGALVADALQGLENLGVKVDPATIRMLRIFRIARLLRLMRMQGGLNRLITTVVVSIPALGNVAMLTGLFLYIATILGIELFHKLPLTGEFINQDANFASFGTAMMTLFRCITGESYNGIMHDAMITEEYSAPGRCYNAEGNCGSLWGAPLFFIIFFLLEAMVMLNLIVAVVLDAFAEEEQAEEMKLNRAQMDDFIDAWKELDREGTSFMPTKDLRKLLFLLNEPLGFEDYAANHDGREPTAFEVNQRLQDLSIPDRVGQVAMHEVLEALGKYALGGEIELPTGTEAEKKLQQQYADVLKQTGMHNSHVSQYSSAYVFNVIRMQAAFRRRMAAKRNAASRPPPPKVPKQPKQPAAAAEASPPQQQGFRRQPPQPGGPVGRPAPPASNRPTPKGRGKK